MKIAVCDDEIILYEELYTLLNEYSTLKKEPILTTYLKPDMTFYQVLRSLTLYLWTIRWTILTDWKHPNVCD